MIILSYDIETTGLDKQKDRIIEVGLVLYSTGQYRILESSGFLVKSDVPVSEEVTNITGITQPALDHFGYEPDGALEDIIRFMSQADAIMAHNGARFDRIVTENTSKRLGSPLPDKLWIDTMTDIPGVKGEQLITMCAKAGVLMMGAHGALIDASSTLEMARRHAIDPIKSFEKMAERAQSPLVLIQSHQGRGNNADAKKFRFRWNPAMKMWWKAVKEMDLEELKQMPFDWSRIDKSITLEQLDTD